MPRRNDRFIDWLEPTNVAIESCPTPDTCPLLPADVKGPCIGHYVFPVKVKMPKQIMVIKDLTEDAKGQD